MRTIASSNDCQRSLKTSQSWALDVTGRLKTSHLRGEGFSCRIPSISRTGGVLHGEPAQDGERSSDISFTCMRLAEPADCPGVGYRPGDGRKACSDSNLRSKTSQCTPRLRGDEQRGPCASEKSLVGGEKRDEACKSSPMSGVTVGDSKPAKTSLGSEAVSGGIDSVEAALGPPVTIAVLTSFGSS